MGLDLDLRYRERQQFNWHNKFGQISSRPKRPTENSLFQKVVLGGSGLDIAIHCPDNAANHSELLVPDSFWKVSDLHSPTFQEFRVYTSSWWFQVFFIFTPTWGRCPFWLIFFKWVETTNQHFNSYFSIHPAAKKSWNIGTFGGFQCFEVKLKSNLNLRYLWNPPTTTKLVFRVAR